ncbi:gamma carbonic anhydrase family protein [Enterobacteriaceae bacterium ESL0689]|nr:gamma carbonic anhydrase family protein [Enterobacteriaceae bacterium ESL0689]
MPDNLRPYKDTLPRTGERVMIDKTSVVIGDVEIADDVSIWPLVVSRADVNSIQIGARTNIQDGSVLHVTHKSPHQPQGKSLIIGEEVTIGHKTILHGCRIGNRVLVGMGTIILDGVIVEDDVIIGAGSLVPQNKHLKSGYLYFGHPVKPARSLTEAELTRLRDSASNYVNWKDDYLNQESQTQP